MHHSFKLGTKWNSGHLLFITEGSFKSSQTLAGQLAEFNMWHSEMSLNQLLSGTCGRKGNVSSWDTLQLVGDSTETYRVFPDCKGNFLLLLSMSTMQIKMP